MRLRRRGVYPAPEAGLLAMTNLAQYQILDPGKVKSPMRTKTSVSHPQEFVAGLQISAFSPKIQAGILCYSSASILACDQAEDRKESQTTITPQQSQAGSLCYNASVFLPRSSVACKQSVVSGIGVKNGELSSTQKKELTSGTSLLNLTQEICFIVDRAGQQLSCAASPKGSNLFSAFRGTPGPAKASNLRA